MKENILLFFKCKISLTKTVGLERHRRDFREQGGLGQPLYRIGTRQSDVSSLRARPLFRLMKNETRTVKLSTRQFTIVNGRIAGNSLLHKIPANQLVSTLQKRIPPRGANKAK
jgi:hypothetical protein